MAHFTGLVFKWVVLIFVSKYCICVAIDLSAEAKKLLESEGINSTDPGVKKLAKSFVLERREAHENIKREREITERERADVLKYKGELEATKVEKEYCARPLRIIAVRSKLVNLVDKNYPLQINVKTNETMYGKPDESYCDALHEMLSSTNSRFTEDVFVMQIRNRLVEHGIISLNVFTRFARWLYSQFSDKAAHKISMFSSNLPEYNDTKGIEDILKCVEVDRDVPAVICIQIVLKPLEMP
ncbi:uncharacterized protein LOC135844539 [Planococcus citri]|uniref:uncharacterized protein LOC135844539 n=1 Tax=Planococcus citri TaxID=170843 RepID=UPI0031F7A731